NHAIWKGALRQSGILEVFSTEELLDTAKALDACPLLNGPRIAVLSGQAGPGIIAADALETVGLRLSCFSEVTQQKVNTLLPPVAIRTNPVDMGPAWYDPNTIMNIMRTTLEDEQTDGVIFIAMYASANLKLAEAIRDYMESVNSFPKPVIGCLTAPPGIWNESTDKLDRKKGLVVLPTPERAAHAMANLWKMNRLMNLKTLDSPGRLNGALT
ncbi:MAG TPA: hypothetical protein VHO84_01295, partial [Syntrophorhabdaceae bacterium]|nr:hypothetical protein [Syntrophorhabdaceae bacterium]